MDLWKKFVLIKPSRDKIKYGNAMFGFLIEPFVPLVLTKYFNAFKYKRYF